MLYTPNVIRYSTISETNISAYARENNYTLYVYHDTTISLKDHPTWNKPKVLEAHIKHHKYIMWMDSDAIFTDFDKKIEDVIALSSKSILLCSDIGGWKFNAGVQIWKNSDYSKQMLQKWYAMEHIEHMKGGDQAQLITLLKHEKDYEIFPEETFNTHPKKHKSGMYVLHMMGYSGQNRFDTFTAWNKKLFCMKVNVRDITKQLLKIFDDKNLKSMYHLDCKHDIFSKDFYQKINYKCFDKNNDIIIENNKKYNDVVFKNEIDIKNIDFKTDVVYWCPSRTPNYDRLNEILTCIKKTDVKMFISTINLRDELKVKPSEVIMDIVGVWELAFLQ